MSIKAMVLGAAMVFAVSGSALACSFNGKMTMAEVPVVEKVQEVANVPVDLWLLPYLV